MPYINIDVDLDEFDDDDLIEELEDRGYTVSDKDEEEDEDEVSETSRKRMPCSYTIKRCFDNKELREHLLNIAGLGSYVSNEELVNRIKELL